MSQVGFVDRMVYRVCPYIYIASVIVSIVVVVRSFGSIESGEFGIRNVTALIMSLILVRMSGHILRERIGIYRETGFDPARKE